MSTLRIGESTLNQILDAQGWVIEKGQVVDSKRSWIGTVSPSLLGVTEHPLFDLTIDNSYLCVILVGKRTDEIWENDNG